MRHVSYARMRNCRPAPSRIFSPVLINNAHATFASYWVARRQAIARHPPRTTGCRELAQLVASDAPVRETLRVHSAPAPMNRLAWRARQVDDSAMRFKWRYPFSVSSSRGP
jgi:hypothetical protein